MNTNFLKSAALATSLLFSAGVFAQDVPATTVAPFSPPSAFRTWSIGLSGGIAAPVLFAGKNDFTHWDTEIGYGLYIKDQILPSFGIRADFFRGKLKGDNSKAYGNGATPNRPIYAFNTDINWSAALGGELTLANISWMFRNTNVQPYITASGGIMGYKPRIQTTSTGAFTDYGSNTRDIRELVIPVGTGFKFNISKGANIDLGYTMNFVDGDNLDGAYYGTQSDRFSYAHLGLEFALGDKSKPQLATYNPVAGMEYDYLAKDRALRNDINNDVAAKLAASNDAAKIAQLEADLARMKADADGDGVSDYFDKCPGTPAGVKVDGSGCALPAPAVAVVQQPDTKIYITEADRKIVTEAINNLEFDFNKATIRPRSYPSLTRVAELLVQKNFSLKLAGHTDNVGSDAYNLKLSKDRAESVKNFLVSKGANPSRIEATGYGESQPIATNGTAAGRQKNRRVEFTLY